MSTPQSKPQQPVRSSPVARKLGAEAGINLTDVRGSGPEGRIIRRDIERWVLLRKCSLKTQQ